MTRMFKNIFSDSFHCVAAPAVACFVLIEMLKS